MPHAELDPSLVHDIYIDESSQTQNRYLVLGGIIVPTRHVDALNQCIEVARLPELPAGEMKWTKVSASKLKAYCRVVEAILSPPPGPLRQIEFHSLVVDTHQLKDRVFNKGSREIGFNKEIYQLCLKFGRVRRTGVFHTYLDQRDTKSSTTELRDILNFGIRKVQSDRDWPYRRVHFRDSAKCLGLQIVDIFLGAIAFKLNGHYAALGASESKRKLSDHVLSLAGVRNVLRDTAVRGRFTIWHRQLK